MLQDRTAKVDFLCRFCFISTNLVSIAIILIGAVIFTGRATAASIEIVEIREGTETRTVEVVRGGPVGTPRQARTFDSSPTTRFQILPGSSGTIRVYDSRRKRFGHCFRVNTFDDLQAIRCRWRG